MEARARAGRPAAALLVGPAGIGKSALLESLARSSTGSAVLVAGGDRRLRCAPGGVVGLLALPLLRRPIPRAIRRELDHVWEGRTWPPERVAEAVLACVGLGRSPLTCLVDDLDELDELDLAAVTALVRLATTEPLVVVATSRAPVGAWPGPTVPLPPLPDTVIRQMLVDEDVHPQVVDQLLPSLAGNPSAARTLLATLTPAERAGMDRVVASVPRDPRLVAAASTDLARAGDADGQLALERVLDDPHDVTTLAAAPPSLRRRAHAAAADRTDGVRALLHRAAAADHPDDALAADLVAEAERRLDAQDLAAAVDLLVAAGSVATDAPLIGTSWYRAAVGSYLTGHHRQALELVDALRTLPGAGVGTFGLDRVEALAGLHVDGVDAVLARIGPAAERAADRGDHAAARSLLLIAGVFSLYGCRAEDLAAFAERAATLPADDPLAAATTTLFSASADLYARADATAVRGLAPLLAGLAEVPAPADPLPDLDLDPSRSQFFAGLLLLTDEHWQAARALLERVWAHDRAVGWTGAHGLDAAWYAQLLWRTGAWSEALEVARDTLAATDPELGRSRLWLHAFLAGAELLVGDPEAAERHRAAVTVGSATSAGIPLVELVMRSGTAVGLLGIGEPARALEHLLVAAEVADGTHPGLVWWRAELVEALVATGQHTAAREASAELRDLSGGPHAAAALRGRALRAAGLASGGRRGLALLAQAVEVHESGGCPFELARSLLALAEARWVLNEDDADIASATLRALRLFDRLGAVGFAARAAAVGGGARSLAGLSPRERQVAELVASGATNDQVATELGISASTVSFHLESIFRKLRIRSRNQLASVVHGG